MTEGIPEPDLAGTVTDLAAEIKAGADENAKVRIAVVTAIQAATGRKVQTDQTGTAWISRLEDTALNVGDRVALLMQGSMWLVVGRLSGEPGAVPIGSILPFAASAAPAGWFNCEGQAISRTTYASLYTLVGNGYGAGDGSTTFNIPNLQGRFPLGQQGLTYFMTTAGGAATVALTQAQLPAHDHGSAGGHTHIGTVGFSGQFGPTGGGQIVLANAAGTEPFTSNNGSHSHGSVGSGQGHENMPPYLVINYIIRAL